MMANSVVANANFYQCKSNIKERAIKLGFSAFITDDIIEGISVITRIVELDKRQPEFTQTFEQYIKARVTDYHVETGMRKLTEHKELFDRLTKEYAVPRQYLVSFWGLETFFGKNKGKMSVLNSLATLACDQRRSKFFTQELFNLFTLLDSKKVTKAQLQGSWAGAMGHMQFMPSAFMQYAVDGDNDGIVDIWQSEIDALTTAANYLHQIGWQQKEHWGREVRLPEDFDFRQVVFDKYYPLSHFKQLGVKKIANSQLSDDKIDTELFLPAGHQGPAFLLYPNFNVIMTWNLSKSYALSVGILANKLMGLEGVKAFSKDNKSTVYSVNEMKGLQNKLILVGLYTGKPDGIWGPKSRNAIRSFQLKHKLVPDGFPNKEVFDTINQLDISLKNAEIKPRQSSE
jgi:membrane-bound lytic murein transglycosylase B